MTDTLQGSMIPETGTVRMEDRFPTSIDDLWSAITDPDRVARWVAVVTGDFRVGGALSATFTSGWTGPLEVEVCDAPHHLRVRSGEGDDETLMEAVLTEDGDGTRLVVEERGLPVPNLPFHGAGWQVHVEDLRSEVAGRIPEAWEPRWKALLPEYQARATE